MFLKTRMKEFFNDSSARPLQIMAGAVAALGLAGTLAYSFQDKIFTPISVPAPEPKSPIVLHMEYPFCSADQVPMKLETDVVARVNNSDLRRVFDNIGEINRTSQKRFNDSVNATAGDKLQRIRNSSIQVINETPLFTQSLNYADLAAKGSVIGVFNQMGIGAEVKSYGVKAGPDSSDVRKLLDCNDEPKFEI